MVRYVAGSQTAAPLGTTGGTIANLPNEGLSIVSVSSADTYTLAPPEQGVRKTLVCTSSSSVARVVRTTTGSGDQTITVGNQTATKITFPAAATMDCVVELVGLSSLRWAITSQVPPGVSTVGGATLSSG